MPINKKCQKGKTYIPMIHNQITGDHCAISQSFSEEEISYIIAFNIGSVWNIIMKWIAYDMRETPDTIKKTILKYLSGLSVYVAPAIR